MGYVGRLERRPAYGRLHFSRPAPTRGGHSPPARTWRGMMAVLRAPVHDVVDETDPLTAEAAYARSFRAALTDSEIGTVGLEVETHLVDLRAVSARVPWDRVEPILHLVGAVAGGSSVTVEPGGQLELSGSAAADILTAVSDMRRDVTSARLALSPLGLGLA